MRIQDEAWEHVPGNVSSRRRSKEPCHLEIHVKPGYQEDFKGVADKAKSNCHFGRFRMRTS